MKHEQMLPHTDPRLSIPDCLLYFCSSHEYRWDITQDSGGLSCERKSGKSWLDSRFMYSIGFYNEDGDKIADVIIFFFENLDGYRSMGTTV